MKIRENKDAALNGKVVIFDCFNDENRIIATIHIDFSKIESIKYSDGEKLIKNLQYTLNFIKNELEPFLNNILT